jgi:hypothetical protein
MRRAFLASAFLVCAALDHSTARAQATPDSACSYTRCALRVDYGFWSTRLVRGNTGERVSRLTWFGGGVGVLLDGSDSTAYYARQYQSRRQAADIIGLLGAALVIAGWAAGDELDDPGAYTLAGLTLGLVSMPFQIGLRRSIDRSIWWYNRDLPRP